MNICLFSPEEINSPLKLRDERAVHILKILHKTEGDTFSAGIINGKSGKAEIISITRHEVTAPNGKTYEDGEIRFKFIPEGNGKPLFPLTMIIGFPRPIQLKRLLRDMAGLGVQEIHLTGTELGEKSYLESDLAKGENGYQMLLEGTQQAASTHIPLLVKHNSLSECLDSILENSAGNTTDKSLEKQMPALISLDNVNASEGLPEWLNKNPLYAGNKSLPVIAAIGSERGWTDNERKLMEQKGFIRLRMGERVLRTETAATVAASLILSSMNVLN